MARVKSTIKNNSELLLGFSRQIALVKSRKDLLELINKELKPLFYFTHSAILICDAEQRFLSMFVHDPASKVVSHPDYMALTGNRFSLEEKFTKEAFYSDSVIIYDIEKLARSIPVGKVPAYMQLQYISGVKKIVTSPLRIEKRQIGLLMFFDNTDRGLDDYAVQVISGITGMVSVATSNILAQEDIWARNKEKEMLLSISNEIAQIRDMNELLTLIATKLKTLFYFSHSNIVTINEDRKTFSTYLVDPQSKAKKHPNFDRFITERFPVGHPLFSKVIRSEQPIIFDLSQIAATGRVPRFLVPQIAIGLKEMVAIPLGVNTQKFGVLSFFSENTGSFSENNIRIIKAVGSQVSIAISNINASQTLLKRNLEREMLLSVSYEIALIKDKNQLLSLINNRLKQLFYFTHSSISMITEDRQAFIVYLTDPQSRSRQHEEYEDLVSTVYKIRDGFFETFLQSDDPVISDYETQMNTASPPKYCRIHFEAGIREVVSIPLHGEKELWGVLHFYSDKKSTFSYNNLEIFKAVASQVSIAVSNILALEEIHEREKEREMLLSLSYEMAKIRDKNELLTHINTKLAKLFYFTHSNISIINQEQKTFTVFLIDPKSRSKKHPDFDNTVSREYPLADGVFDKILSSEEPTISYIKRNALSPNPPKYSTMHYESGLLEAVSIPLYMESRAFGVITFYSDREGDFTPKTLRIIKGMSSQVAIAVSNILANQKIIKQFEEINRYRQQLEQENIYLQQEIGTTYNYSEIIGSGAAMQQVYKMLAQVSFTNSTVLILGETGTGKELIARAVHNNSSRKDKLMIKVNCAALPANLIESELFGHERGSFTGALERRIGKFELANNSTLFLDEIGELPLELQSKLLRAIQEKEIERVGGNTTIKINVRIIAATNRDLLKEVNEGRFRSDLFYRLNVFPVYLPPLRERKEDLPALATHFIKHFSRNTGIKISNISALAMKKMMAYSWPGNIRELEHLIERSILLANGPVLKEIYLPDTLKKTDNDGHPNEEKVKTIAEVEKEHILSVLALSKGRVQGPGGAAELLQLPATTLHSKMKKLNIVKTHTTRTD